MKEEKKKVDNKELYAVVRLKDAYIDNWVNACYFLARYNMLAEQIGSKVIEEKVDGVLKTEEYMMAELMMSKVRAIKAFRGAYFNEVELTKHGFSQKDLLALKKDYYDKPIVRKTYAAEPKAEGGPPVASFQ